MNASCGCAEMAKVGYTQALKTRDAYEMTGARPLNPPTCPPQNPRVFHMFPQEHQVCRHPPHWNPAQE